VYNKCFHPFVTRPPFVTFVRLAKPAQIMQKEDLHFDRNANAFFILTGITGGCL